MQLAGRAQGSCQSDLQMMRPPVMQWHSRPSTSESLKLPIPASTTPGKTKWFAACSFGEQKTIPPHNPTKMKYESAVVFGLLACASAAWKTVDEAGFRSALTTNDRTLVACEWQVQHPPTRWFEVLIGVHCRHFGVSCPVVSRTPWRMRQNETRTSSLLTSK